MRMEGYVVVGGGLAGLVCAARLHRAQRLAAIIDAPVGVFSKNIGGFAEFSGAKFSLPPAGSGLTQVAGSESALRGAMQEVIQELGLERFQLVRSSDVALAAGALQQRAYDSFVLTPAEMTDVVTEMASKIPVSQTLRERVTRMRAGPTWEIETDSGRRLTAQGVVFAGGRTGADLLSTVGAVEQQGRGIDVGVRLEFNQREGIAPLRALGADAKILMGACRTFCLNSPGTVLHYEVWPGLLVPGGVVADPQTETANVGVLCRMPNKREELQRIKEAQHILAAVHGSYVAHTATDVINPETLTPVLGTVAVQALGTFVANVIAEGLVRVDTGVRVHFPLLDWHWPVFAVGATFKTSLEGLYVIGDLAGHARGLLQSAVSGWLLAGELQ